MLPIAVLSTLLVLFTAAPSTEALPTLASHSRRSRLSANNVRNQRAPADDTLVERHSSSFSAFLRTLRRAKADPIEQASFASVAIDVPALLRFKKRDLVGVVNPKSRRQIGETETHLSADEEVYDEGAIPSREVARRRYLALHENDKRDLADECVSDLSLLLLIIN